ncbi:hypothetical protein Tco_0889533 [Tanacetum coccineum]
MNRFKEVVNEAWNYHVSGFYMFRMVKKLKNLKKPLRKLMIDKGNLHANVERIRGELDTIHTQLDTDPFNIRLREIEAANVVAFNQAVLDKEMFLKQKAKISWLKDGDSNTAYFHNCLDGRGSTHMVCMVTDREIKEAMFSMGDEKSPGPAKLFLDKQGAAHMVRMVTDREIKDAMFSMGGMRNHRVQMGSLLRFSKKLDILWVLMSLMLSCLNFLRMAYFVL